MNSIHRHGQDWQLLIRLKENLIDLDIVDDARQDVESAVERLRAAVAARDAIAQYLADLIGVAA